MQRRLEKFEKQPVAIRVTLIICGVAVMIVGLLFAYDQFDKWQKRKAVQDVFDQFLPPPPAR